MRGTLILAPSVVRALLDEAWSAWPEETGGVLLGTVSRAGVHVTEVVGPGPGAVHRTTSFEPDADWQAQQVARLWAAGQQLTYLGDWHTHPNGSTALSALDRGAMRTIAASPDAQQTRPVMLVLGLAADGGVRVRAERLMNGRTHTLSLRVEPNDLS